MLQTRIASNLGEFNNSYKLNVGIYCQQPLRLNGQFRQCSYSNRTDRRATVRRQGYVTENDQVVRRPFNKVGDVMSVNKVTTVSPETTIASIIPKFKSVTGILVKDEHQNLVGVITQKDIKRAQEHGSIQGDKVRDHMSSPVITVHKNAHVSQATELMLSKRIQRVFVVDDDKKLVGVISRSDIFLPKLDERIDIYKYAKGEAFGSM